MEWRNDDQSTYVNTIENCFIEIRGRGVLWSPADGERAAAWYATGMPLGAVLRVVEARVRAWRFLHGEHARLPMHLRYYEPALLEHCGHLRRLGSGLGDVLEGELLAEAPTTVTDLLAELPALIEASTLPAMQHAYRAAFALLDKGLRPPDETEAAGAAARDGLDDLHLAGHGGHDRADGSVSPHDLVLHRDAGPLCQLDDAAIDALLDRCRSLLSRTLQKALSPEELAAIQGAIDGELAPFGMQLSRKALAARRTVLLERALAARFGMRVATRYGWQDPAEVA